MVKKFIVFLLPLFMLACNQAGSFSISGNLTDADAETIYFEKNGLLKDSLIDSLKLNKAGQFKFKTKVPAYPELYSLRLKGQRLVLTVDSAVKIEITGSAKKLIDAVITNSPESEKIQDLRKSVINLQNDFSAISNANNESDKLALRDTFQTRLELHRRKVFDMILDNPTSMASYFALYQQISGNYIFSPYIKEDLNFFRAVITSFDNKMPDFDRTKNLYALVIDAIKQERLSRKTIDWTKLEISEERGILEIELLDKNGYPKKLSDFNGSPVLLDFSAYRMKNAVNHIFELREIYSQYSSEGLQIYQVSLDENRLAWIQSVSNIPWTVVLDETGRAAQTYNVQNIPTLYLIDKEGNIVAKYSDAKSAKLGLSNIL